MIHLLFRTSVSQLRAGDAPGLEMEASERGKFPPWCRRGRSRMIGKSLRCVSEHSAAGQRKEASGVGGEGWRRWQQGGEEVALSSRVWAVGRLCRGCVWDGRAAPAAAALPADRSVTRPETDRSFPWLSPKGENDSQNHRQKSRVVGHTAGAHVTFPFVVQV